MEENNCIFHICWGVNQTSINFKPGQTATNQPLEALLPALPPQTVRGTRLPARRQDPASLMDIEC